MYPLFDKDIDFKVAVQKTPEGAQMRQEIIDIATVAIRQGFFDENNFPVRPVNEIQKIMEHDIMVRKALSEVDFGLTRGDTPEHFLRGYVFKPSIDRIPDSSYLDWMVATMMDDVTEDRVEWGANIEFVRLDKHGQVKLASLAGETSTIRNYEWVSGIPISLTWFETNKFKINFERLIPKFQFKYFDQIADAIYTGDSGVVPIFTNATVYTESLVRTINAAMTALRRYERTLTSTTGTTATERPFENAKFRIVAPWELKWAIDAALNNQLLAAAGATERVDTSIAVTYTAKLTDASKFYVVVDKWEQNEYATRVALAAHGPVDNIETFCKEMTFRGAYGLNLDINSAKLVDLTEVSPLIIAEGLKVYSHDVTPD